MRLRIFPLMLAVFLLPIYGQEKGSQPSANQESAKTAKQPAPQPPPSSPASQINVINQEAPKQQGGRAADNPKGYLSRLFSPENLPSIGLFLAGVAGIFVALSTLKVLSRQARSMRRQTRVLRLNAQALINSERPWVVVTVHRYKDEAKQFRFDATNQGRTPAKIVSWEVGHDFISDPMQLPIPPVYKPAVRPRSLLVYGQSFPVFGIEPEWGARNQGVAGEVFDSSKVLCVYGRVGYFDLVGKTDKPVFRETRWCYVYAIKEKRFVQGGPDEYHRHT